VTDETAAPVVSHWCRRAEENVLSINKSMAAVLPALAFSAILSLGTAMAAGDGGGSGGNSGGSSDPDGNSQIIKPVKCKSGQVFDPQASSGKGKCVNAADIKKPARQKQGMIYDYGKQLAKAGEYELAIATLSLAPDQQDPRVLNYLGYSHRKLGKMDKALEYYHAAVDRNPDFSLVREYLGEAYIQLGQLENAREQLTEIERICGGRQCGEYGQLADLIVASQAR